MSLDHSLILPPPPRPRPRPRPPPLSSCSSIKSVFCSFLPFILVRNPASHLSTRPRAPRMFPTAFGGIRTASKGVELPPWQELAQTLVAESLNSPPLYRLLPLRGGGGRGAGAGSRPLPALPPWREKALNQY
eukprot:765572-Hanusia_phi.AAC.6